MNIPTQTPRIDARENGGFTIVEIMVAMTISLILLLGVIQIFMASQTSYEMQSGVSRLQENARFTLDIMARTLGMAGAQGATAIDTADTHDNYTNEGFSPTSGTIQPVAGSDTISVSYLAATDCQGAATGGTATDIYFIGVDTADPNLVPNLYCNNGVNNQPLVEGIENLQILYGQDTDSDGVPNVYVSRGNVTNWSQIATIRIAILASTVNDSGIGINNTSYRLLNSPELGPFNDTLIRRVFTRTILLRNYIP